MILNSAGIIDASLVRSESALNFGYIIYLVLKSKGISPAIIEHVVRRWVVLSILTERYSATSNDTAFVYDIKNFKKQEPEEFLHKIEAGELSEAFWNISLISRLNTSVKSSPYFLVFVMAQIKNNARGFLSKDIKISSLIKERGDIHHIFPKKYLQNNGFDDRKDYNQIANYAYAQSEINIQIKDKSPSKYIAEIQNQVTGGKFYYGGISTLEDLSKNLAENCISENFMNMNAPDYQGFLEKRRILMSKYIRDYYYSL